MEKEDTNEPDFSSLNKYFRDDLGEKPEPVKVNTIIEDISISESVFRSYTYSEGNEVGTSEGYNKVEKISEEDKKKISPAKKKFLKDIEESDSLSIDTCISVGRDWGRG